MRSKLALLLVLLAAPLALLGGGSGSADEPRGPRLADGAFLSAWGDVVRDLGDPRSLFRPNTYYADDFGAYYFDKQYNKIYAAAAFPSETGVGSFGKASGGGGGGVGCWQFTFAQVGYFYPNPSGSESIVKANANLLVLGTDYQFYTAGISTRVVNSTGQTVRNQNLGTFGSSPNFVLNVWDGKNNAGQPVGSGWYNITVTATSGLCGTKSFSGPVTRIN